MDKLENVSRLHSTSATVAGLKGIAFQSNHLHASTESTPHSTPLLLCVGAPSADCQSAAKAELGNVHGCGSPPPTTDYSTALSLLHPCAYSDIHHHLFQLAQHLTVEHT